MIEPVISFDQMGASFLSNPQHYLCGFIAFPPQTVEARHDRHRHTGAPCHCTENEEVANVAEAGRPRPERNTGGVGMDIQLRDSVVVAATAVAEHRSYGGEGKRSVGGRP